MTKLTIIVGMAGSGKTALVKQLARSGAIVYSDFTLVDLTKHDQRAGHKKLPELVAKVLNGKDVVANEAHLTDPAFRAEFIRFVDSHLAGRVDVEWIYFERDVVACAANVISDWKAGRKEPLRVTSLLSQMKCYSVPPDATPRRCYSTGSPPFRDEAAAEVALRALL